MHVLRIFLALILLWAFLPVKNAYAIPAFARQTGASCTLCHRAYPELNAFGKDFLARGYMLAEQPPGVTVPTADPNLTLLEHLPLALRMQFDILSRPDERPAPDFQTPVIAKLFSGGAISKNVAYYIYFMLAERGDVAGIEDAWVLVHDAPLKGLGIQAGQFQIMDVTFPRELRLTRQDYLIYTTPQSDSGFRLTYQRGVNLSYDIGPVAWVGGIVNGNGTGSYGEGAGYPGRNDPLADFDAGKVGYSRLGTGLNSLRLGEFSLGLFGLAGAEGKDEAANHMWRAGPDAEYTRGPLRVFAQFLTGMDSNPTFQPNASDPDDLRISGGLAGASYLLTDRWVLAALYNRVMSERSNRDANLATANAAYYWRRNFKIGLEGSVDLQPVRTNHPTSEHSVILFADLAY